MLQTEFMQPGVQAEAFRDAGEDRAEGVEGT